MKSISTVLIGTLMLSGCSHREVVPNRRKMPYVSHGKPTGTVVVSFDDREVDVSVTVNDKAVGMTDGSGWLTIYDVPVGKAEVRAVGSSLRWREALNYSQTVTVKSDEETRVNIPAPPYGAGYWVSETADAVGQMAVGGVLGIAFGAGIYGIYSLTR